MAESNGTEVPNGVYVEVIQEEETNKYEPHGRRVDPTLYSVLHGLISMILFPDQTSILSSSSLPQRIKIAVSEKGPLLVEASRNTGRDVLLWTRRGSPLRALLVVSVGTISGLTLTGLFVFVLFFIAASANAIIIALLMSLAAAGGFFALFFAGLTAIYIGAFSVAVFVISTATFVAIIAALVAAGWIGFFLTIWLATKKGVDLAKHSLDMTGSALSAYSVSRRAHRHHEANKHSD